MTARRDFLAGVRALAPILLGVIPFGLVAGVTAVEAGLTPVQAVGMSAIMFAGASQLAAIDLFGRTAPLAVIVLTALVINLRFVMYSASLAPYLRRAGGPARWVGAYLLTDQAYAVSVAEYSDTTPAERSRTWFYLGGAVTLWLPWQVATGAGAVAGAALPPGLSLEFAVPLTFMALVVPAVEDRWTAAAGGIAAVAGVLAAPLPFDLGLVSAALVGIAAGVGLELRAGEFPTTEDREGERGGTDDPSGGDGTADDPSDGDDDHPPAGGEEP